jgi:hypothetical protein
MLIDEVRVLHQSIDKPNLTVQQEWVTIATEKKT